MRFSAVTKFNSRRRFASTRNQRFHPHLDHFRPSRRDLGLRTAAVHQTIASLDWPALMERQLVMTGHQPRGIFLSAIRRGWAAACCLRLGRSLLKATSRASGSHRASSSFEESCVRLKRGALSGEVVRSPRDFQLVRVTLATRHWSSNAPSKLPNQGMGRRDPHPRIC
jgi:hypothetical protein